MSTRPQVELLEKNKPRQERAKRTYEAILSAAAQLLVEVGVERISTNLIAERAGITVPALYRYFPNKYAVLNALGITLIEKQTQAFEVWFEDHVSAGDSSGLVKDTYQLLRAVYDVTQAQEGGLEIMQALRTVAPLQAQRLASHRKMTDDFCTLLEQQIGKAVDDDARATARLTIETGYALVLMTLEDDSLCPDRMLKSGASMVEAYWRKFLEDFRPAVQ
ncbi:MAG: TetR/AcrR family transcriptional regulator [Halioglobus sp.]